MKRLVLLFIMTITLFLSFGRDEVIVSFHNEKYKICQSTINQNIICFDNNTDQNQWLFFEPDTIISNQSMINNRFRKKNAYGMSMFQCIMDVANWTEFTPNLENSFVKIIQPNEIFSIVVLDSNKKDFYINSIRIIPQEEILDIFKSLELIIDSSSPIIYKPHILVIHKLSN